MNKEIKTQEFHMKTNSNEYIISVINRNDSLLDIRIIENKYFKPHLITKFINNMSDLKWVVNYCESLRKPMRFSMLETVIEQEKYKETIESIFKALENLIDDREQKFV